MVERYIRGTLAQVEDLHQKLRTEYLAAYLVEFPNSQTRTATNYTDRITGTVADTIIQLSDDGKDHSDRVIDPTNHPSTDEKLLKYNTDNESDSLDPAFYLKSSVRTRLGADIALVEEDRTTVETRGFFSDGESNS